MKLAFLAPIVLAACLTPQQVQTITADAQAAANIIASLAPVACAIVDTTDVNNAQAVCLVITDASTGASELVPVVGSLAALLEVVATKPATAALTQAIANPAFASLLKRRK